MMTMKSNMNKNAFSVLQECIYHFDRKKSVIINVIRHIIVEANCSIARKHKVCVRVCLLKTELTELTRQQDLSS